MAKIGLLLAFAWFPTLVSACEGMTMKTSVDHHLYPYGITEDCGPQSYSMPLSENARFDADSLGSETDDSDTNYWSEWTLKTESNPFISQQFADKYFGIGVWAPDEFSDLEDDQSMQDWMMDHGLQFSVGFGEKRIGEPRLRFDYLWHDNEQDQMFMQLELPF